MFRSLLAAHVALGCRDGVGIPRVNQLLEQAVHGTTPPDTDVKKYLLEEVFSSRGLSVTALVADEPIQYLRGEFMGQPLAI